MCAVFSAGERGRTGEVSRIVEAGRSMEEKTPRPRKEGICLLVGCCWLWCRCFCIEMWMVAEWQKSRFRVALSDVDAVVIDNDRFARVHVVDVDGRICYLLLLCI